jgi:streptogramin lyase
MTTIVGALAPGGRGGDGGPACDAAVFHPSGVIVDHDGNLVIADSNNGALRLVDGDGIIRTIAGGHGFGYSGDGGPAVDAQLSQPTMMVVDSVGNLLIADRDNHAIRRIDRDGVITTVAGGNGEGNTGDGGPATSALLNRPRGLAIDADGALYLTDRDNHSVRRIDPTGIITTVIGGGFGYAGDGGPASEACLKRPRGLAFDRAGALYIADRNNHAIRKVDGDGTISTFAGGNGDGYGGDGGPATEAQLNFPSGIVFDRAGNAYISDHLNHAIRKVDRAGVMSTVVGGNGAGFTGDGGPADAAQIFYPSGLELGPTGDLYIADRNNNAVRAVAGIGDMQDGATPLGPPARGLRARWARRSASRAS